MKTSLLATIKGYLQGANQWFLRTPERALDEAYEAALRIKAIEDAHFGGSKISTDYGTYSKSAQDYFQSELTKYLNIAKVRLAEFKTSSSILQIPNQKITEIQLEENADLRAISIIDKPGLILKKLRIVDEVLARYSSVRQKPSSLISISESTQITDVKVRQSGRIEPQNNSPDQSAKKQPKPDLSTDGDSIADKTGVLPRSILRTVDRIKRELDPKAEEQVVDSFRSSKARTVISLRFILLLIIIPLLTQQISKNFLIGPLVDSLRDEEQAEVFLNAEMEEEALDELHRYEERIRFESFIGKAPPISEEAIAEVLRHRASEIEEEYRQRSSNAIKNVFSDLISLIAFTGVIYFSKREIEVLKSFFDELVYGLSDSAKAFIIILLTDTFVGFHSPHGWEVILEGVSRHLGLPANRDFIFLFIATFPVILDTVFKYWIFRYLNRISPSAVATYKTMNE
ncbi:proton extrusion protein PcxA [Leptolyngbya sp. FACHB-541]|uniref:proton extrusion protein PcxA n=1 Tax=Leptolyngbya sp. FACHB-541 TaxID=2692810 RepID=UPI0016823232|nr:proton extrusion protein PcxA [Leptolyngbya sp. FACHB-541]MBD2001249.1 proton extrusion protein PcxA [Leptolyngbya sp. FACHB-541]